MRILNTLAFFFFCIFFCFLQIKKFQTQFIALSQCIWDFAMNSVLEFPDVIHFSWAVDNLKTKRPITLLKSLSSPDWRPAWSTCEHLSQSDQNIFCKQSIYFFPIALFFPCYVLSTSKVIYHDHVRFCVSFDHLQHHIYYFKNLKIASDREGSKLRFQLKSAPKWQWLSYLQILPKCSKSYFLWTPWSKIQLIFSDI